jgi:hypothetical protein
VPTRPNRQPISKKNTTPPPPQPADVARRVGYVVVAPVQLTYSDDDVRQSIARSMLGLESIWPLNASGT